MAENSSLISSLKSSIPESSWPWVIPALKHDQIFWESLSDNEFFDLASNAISEPREWSPNKLAALCLEITDLKSFDKEIAEECETKLDEFLQLEEQTSLDEMSLNLAAQIALAIYARFEDNFLLLIGDLFSELNDLSKWATPLAIYFGLFPDLVECLIAFIHQNPQKNSIPVTIHAFLCQPIPPEEQQQQLDKVLAELSLDKTTSVLSSLNKHRPALAMQLANEWLENFQRSPFDLTSQSSYGKLSRLTELLLAAEIYTLANQSDLAEKFKSQSLNFINELQEKITSELVGETLHTKNLEQSLSLWTNISTPPKLIPPAGLIVELLKSGRIDDSMSLLPEMEGSSQTPIRWLNNIYKALDNEDVGQARLFAHQALISFEENIGSNAGSLEHILGSQQDILAYLVELIHQLTNLAMYKEAYQAAKFTSLINPDDPEVLITVTKTGRSAGDYEKSIEAAELAVAIDPTNPEYRRQLAFSLEAAGHWSTSLRERQAILEHRFAQPKSPSWPTSEDLLALANCSINADQPQKALDVCQKAIDLDPSNGQAHALLGEALTSLGEIDQALEHFNLATQLAPHKAAPWLSLANAHHRAGQVEKSIETLRTASHAVPDDPALFYELGQVYIEENSPSQAQSAFARAYQLVSEPNAASYKTKSKNEHQINVDQITHNREQLCEIALSYGDILKQLGHADQAHHIFENAYQSYPSYPGLAYIYAKSMMDMGEEVEAIAPMAVAVAAEPSEPQPYIEYARILLLAQENPGEAVQSIQKALQILENRENNSSNNYSEVRDMAITFLAQAQEASGDLQNALLTYSQALETDLGREDSWRTDLAIGMGRVALRLDQPEVAIAALQDTDRDEIQNTEIAQILCEAYAAINLKQEALFAARTAVHLAPDDIEILSWFAERVAALGVIAEAIPALTRAVQLAPKRTDLIIRLGQVLSRMGKDEDAKEAFLSALSSPYSTPEDLYLAADGLSDLGEGESAADCLERALELQPHPPVDLILELASAYTAADKIELAIKTIDKGVDQDPENALLHIYKADLLGKLDRQQAAQACLEHALILEPENPYVHFKIAHVLRDQGNLVSAFEHARIASDTLKTGTFAISAKGLVAELARSTLQDDIIQEVLESPTPQDGEAESTNQSFFRQPNLFDYYCIVAEHALESEEQIAAAGALNDAYLLDPEHPRVFALQSRLALRQGDRDSALESLAAAIDKVKDPDLEEIFDHIQPNSLLGIALSAIELYKWDLANEYLDAAVSISQNDGNIRLQRTRLYVLRAEFQRICLSLDIVNHAPGTVALSPRTYRIFEESLRETIDCLSGDLQVEFPAVIHRWRIRGEVAFHPELETINSLEIETLGASDQAAVLQALAQHGDISSTARLYHTIQSQADSETLHHCVYAAYALALSTTGQDQIAQEQAQEAIQQAIEQNQIEPIYYAILAKIAEKSGDWQVSLKSMETAVTLWSNEPRWQSYLGQIHRLNDEFPEAIAHFEKAIEIEPNFLQHYIDLSQAHLAYGQADEAILVLRKSLRIAPEQVEPYLALANAQYQIQDYPQAIKNAQLAANIAPDKQAPLLVSAKIAIKMSDPGKAKIYAESALRINPDSPEALHLQAQAFYATGNAERALNIVEKAIPLSKDPLPLLLQRAEMLSQLEGPQANLAALQSIADEYPDQPIVLAPFAKALANSGNNPDAIQSAQQALHRNSGQLPLDEQAKLHNLLGSLLQQSGQLDQSIHHLAEAIRISPSTMDSYLNLGSTQVERRQYEQALETYQKAIRIHPSDPRPYFQAGLLLKDSRDYPAAEKMLRRAAEKAPDDVAIHRQLAAMVALNLVHNRQPVSSEV